MVNAASRLPIYWKFTPKYGRMRSPRSSARSNSPTLTFSTRCVEPWVVLDRWSPRLAESPPPGCRHRRSGTSAGARRRPACCQPIRAPSRRAAPQPHPQRSWLISASGSSRMGRRGAKTPFTGRFNGPHAWRHHSIRSSIRFDALARMCGGRSIRWSRHRRRRDNGVLPQRVT